MSKPIDAEQQHCGCWTILQIARNYNDSGSNKLVWTAVDTCEKHSGELSVWPWRVEDVELADVHY